MRLDLLDLFDTFCSTATTVRSSHRRVSQGRAASF